MNNELRAEICRYLSHGWEWRAIAAVLRRRTGAPHTAAGLREEYSRQDSDNRLSAPEEEPEKV